MSDGDGGPSDALKTVIDTRLKRTSSGAPFEIQRMEHGDIIAQRVDDASERLSFTPQQLLNELKRGEYYLPNHPSDFQDALRTLSER